MHQEDFAIRDLRKQYEEIQGEVSILRLKLKNVQEASNSEQEKKEQEWNHKLITLRKENNSITSQLELKVGL